MKKVLFIVMIAAVAIMFASAAFAVTTITPTGTTTIGGASFVPSTGVTVKASTDNVGVRYTVTAQHLASDPTKGGVQWAATNGTSTILKKIANSDGAPDDPGTAGTAPSGFN